MRLKPWAVLVALGMMSGTASAQSTLTSYFHYTYYSSVLKTEIVGYYATECDGTSHGNGELTLYSDEDSGDCP